MKEPPHEAPAANVLPAAHVVVPNEPSRESSNAVIFTGKELGLVTDHVCVVSLPRCARWVGEKANAALTATGNAV